MAQIGAQRYRSGMVIRNKRLTVLLSLLGITAAASLTYYNFFYWYTVRSSVAVSPDGMFRARIVERKNAFGQEHHFTLYVRPVGDYQPAADDDAHWIPIRGELNNDSDAGQRSYLIRWLMNNEGKTLALAIDTQFTPLEKPLRKWLIPQSDVLAGLRMLEAGPIDAYH